MEVSYSRLFAHTLRGKLALHQLEMQISLRLEAQVPVPMPVLAHDEVEGEVPRIALRPGSGRLRSGPLPPAREVVVLARDRRVLADSPAREVATDPAKRRRTTDRSASTQQNKRRT